MIILTPYYGRTNDSKFDIRQNYLEQTIRSIDIQDINFHHIIIDDGSTDGTFELLSNKYECNSKRTILKRNRSDNDLLTCTNALNFGFEYVIKNYNKFQNFNHISILHSDDLAISLNKRIDLMEKNNLNFLYSDALLFFNVNDPCYLWKGDCNLEIGDKIENYWIKGTMPYPTMTWKIDFLKDIQRYIKQKYGRRSIYNSNIGCGEDVDLALCSLETAMEFNKKIGYLPDLTAGYRIHDNSLAEIRDSKIRKKEENTVLKNHFGNFKSRIIHFKRFLLRPECYFPSLMKFRPKESFKYNLSDIINI